MQEKILNLLKKLTCCCKDNKKATKEIKEQLNKTEINQKELEEKIDSILELLSNSEEE